jgi:hypothetical protein
MATRNQVTVASSKATVSPRRGNTSQATRAKAARPPPPRAAPAASCATASRARPRGSTPLRRAASLSCFSSKVALAGKITGKARKSPATTGPKCRAIRPVATLTSPPSTKRTRSSWPCVFLAAARSTDTLLTTAAIGCSMRRRRTAPRAANRPPRRARPAIGLEASPSRPQRHTQ